MSADIDAVKSDVSKTRSEFNNIRKQIHQLQCMYKKDLEKINKLLQGQTDDKTRDRSKKRQLSDDFHSGTTSSKIQGESSGDITGKRDLWTFKPIGHIESVYRYKNGTPRQPGICESSQASLTISRDVFSNPHHSLEGLEHFSHLWVLFLFHKNNNAYAKAKTKPPRLDGGKVGLFSTRCPYRPNPVGLSLVKIQKIEGDTVYLSGVDMLDGTPVLDIKPYIPEYDIPRHKADNSISSTKENAAQNANESDHITSDSELLFTTPNRVAAECCDSPKDLVDTCLVPDLPVRCVETSCQEVAGSKQSPSRPGVSNIKVAASNSGNPSTGILDDTATALAETIQPKHATESTEFPSSSRVISPSSSSDERSICAEDMSNPEGGPDSALSTAAGIISISDKTQTYFNEKGNNMSTRESCLPDENVSDEAEVANWIKQPPIKKLRVRFTATASAQITQFNKFAESTAYRLNMFNSVCELKAGIISILEADPRSSYRRKKCRDRLYYFVLDCVHITCWFDDWENAVEVLRTEPVAFIKGLPQTGS